jgi:hypothetical protein
VPPVVISNIPKYKAFVRLSAGVPNPLRRPEIIHDNAVDRNARALAIVMHHVLKDLNMISVVPWQIGLNPGIFTGS